MTRARRAGVGVACLVLGLACLAAGPALARRGPARADAPDIRAAATPPAAVGSGVGAPSTTVPVSGTTPGSTVRPAPPVAPRPPVAWALPARGLRAAVVPVAVQDGRLAVPGDPSVVGWWAGGAGLGAAPGRASGAVVLAGHLDTADAGPGAFAALLDVGAGEQVVLEDGLGGTSSYIVTSRTSYPKADLPPGAFTDAAPGQLVLVTCGGEFDRGTGHYADNVVVVADPVAAVGPSG